MNIGNKKSETDFSMDFNPKPKSSLFQKNNISSNNGIAIIKIDDNGGNVIFLKKIKQYNENPIKINVHGCLKTQVAEIKMRNELKMTLCCFSPKVIIIQSKINYWYKSYFVTNRSS